MPRHLWPLAPLLLVTCGDDLAGSSVDQDLVCGAPGPHRVLALAADERIHPDTSVLRVEDRLLFVTSDDTLTPSDPPRTTVYATGPCGEDPRIVGEDISRIFTDEHWPGRVFGCHEAAHLVVLDPHGETDPVRVATGACGASFTDHGLVWYEGQRPIPDQGSDVGALRAMYLPYPVDLADIPPPRTLLADIPYTSEGLFAEATDDALFARQALDLARVSLPDGAVTLEQPNVDRFDVTRDGRFLAWQAGDAQYSTPVEQTGPLSLRDRDAHVDRELGDGAIGFDRSPIVLDRFVLPPRTDQVLVLPDLVTHELRGGRFLLELADGRWLVGGAAYVLFDPVTGEQTALTDRVGDPWPTREHLNLWIDDAELWRFPYDGAPPTRLTTRRGAATELGDGRIVMLVDPDVRGLGDLVLVDRDTLAEHRLDTRASLRLALAPGVLAPELVAYTVSDGARSGVWLARPAS